MTSAEPTSEVLRLRDISWSQVAEVLDTYQLQLSRVPDGQPIPGSYWGECEAGIIGSVVYARSDTPVHSLLHEACHLIVLPVERRSLVHTDATDSIDEDDATCYLQILLSDLLVGVGRQRAMQDMDAWGYTYRLGSTRAWFEQDAENACDWLTQRGLLPLHATKGQ